MLEESFHKLWSVHDLIPDAIYFMVDFKTTLGNKCSTVHRRNKVWNSILGVIRSLCPTIRSLRSSLDSLLSDCVSVEVSLLSVRRRCGFWRACLWEIMTVSLLWEERLCKISLVDVVKSTGLFPSKNAWHLHTHWGRMGKDLFNLMSSTLNQIRNAYYPGPTSKDSMIVLPLLLFSEISIWRLK
jgi:hypothetical protein